MFPERATCQELLSAYLGLVPRPRKDSSVICIDFGPPLTGALLLGGSLLSIPPFLVINRAWKGILPTDGQKAEHTAVALPAKDRLFKQNDSSWE